VGEETVVEALQEEEKYRKTEGERMVLRPLIRQ
jgi:hypothetical protein